MKKNLINPMNYNVSYNTSRCFSEKINIQKSTCFFCGKNLGQDVTKDHLIPTARGGKKGWKNVVLAHDKCNKKKGHRLPTKEELMRFKNLFGFLPHENTTHAKTIIEGKPEKVKPKFIQRVIMYRNSYHGGDGWTYHPMAVTISAACPLCGCERGDPKQHRFHEDGEWFTVQKWKNDCGHMDLYSNLYREHLEIKKLLGDVI